MEVVELAATLLDTWLALKFDDEDEVVEEDELEKVLVEVTVDECEACEMW